MAKQRTVIEIDADIKKFKAAATKAKNVLDNLVKTGASKSDIKNAKDAAKAEIDQQKLAIKEKAALVKKSNKKIDTNNDVSSIKRKAKAKRDAKYEANEQKKQFTEENKQLKEAEKAKKDPLNQSHLDLKTKEGKEQYQKNIKGIQTEMAARYKKFRE